MVKKKQNFPTFFLVAEAKKKEYLNKNNQKKTTFLSFQCWKAFLSLFFVFGCRLPQSQPINNQFFLFLHTRDENVEEKFQHFWRGGGGEIFPVLVVLGFRPILGFFCPSSTTTTTTTQPPTVACKLEAQLKYVLHVEYTFLHVWRRFVCSVSA